MASLLMCRICLVKDVRMHLLLGTYLQEVYEELTAMPIMTVDNRPIVACYICHARLKNCHELRIRCLQSENFFTQILSSNALAQEDICNRNRLKITPVLHLSMGDVVQQKDCAVKMEAPETVAVAEEGDPESMFLDIDNGVQQDYYVELEVMKTEPDDIARDLEKSQGDARDETLTDSSQILEPAMENTPNDGWIRKKLIFIDDNENKLVCVKKKDRPYRLDESGRKLYECDVCCTSYCSVSNLRRHNRRFHLTLNQYQCNICHKICDSEVNLNRHIIMHTKKKSLQCDICHQSYASKARLNQHIKRYSDKSNLHTFQKLNQCDFCQKCFTRSNNLKKHIYSVHTRIDNPNNIKIFTCDVCKKDFTSKGTITNHMRTHTGEKPFQCNICKTSFSDKSTLNKHILVHYDEKPFQCDKCDKGFKRKSHLETHIRLHTGVKPYQCNVCEQRFNQKIHLSVHIRTHMASNQEKPYVCSLCSQCFSHKSCLTRHKSRAHNLNRI